MRFSSLNTKGEKNTVPYLHVTGRFGINNQEQLNLEGVVERIGSSLKKKDKDQKPYAWELENSCTSLLR